MDRHINPPRYRCPEPQREGHRHMTSNEVQIGGEKNDRILAVTTNQRTTAGWAMELCYLCVRCRIIIYLVETRSVDSQAVRLHHMTGVAIKTDMIETEILYV
jgi:hypothetical protein